MIEDVEVRPGLHGNGLFARRSLGPGEFIFRRRYSQFLSRDQADGLPVEKRQYVSRLDTDRWAVVLPPGRYVNHSCEPNARRSGVNVYAWNRIAAGDEITLDYRLNALSDSEPWPCFCGTVSCSGQVVASFFNMDPEWQRQHLPYAAAFIRREYRSRLQRPA